MIFIGITITGFIWNISLASGDQHISKHQIILINQKMKNHLGVESDLDEEDDNIGRFFASLFWSSIGIISSFYIFIVVYSMYKILKLESSRGTELEIPEVFISENNFKANELKLSVKQNRNL